MSHTINRMFNDAKFDDIDGRTRKALADHGFGVLTEIEHGVEVSAIHPVASMQAIENAGLTAVAGDVRKGHRGNLR